MTVAIPIARTTELHQGVVSDVSSIRSLQVSLGRRLLELRRLGRFGFAGTTTFSLYCEQVGLSASEGRSLADLAEASEKRPGLADAVVERGITLSQAGMVAEVERRPDLLRPGEDWLRMAGQGTTADLRRWLDHRKEEVLSGRPVTSLEVALTDRADVLFRRCRDLVSRSVGSMVTPGQALETVCDDIGSDPSTTWLAPEGSWQPGSGAAGGHRGLNLPWPPAAFLATAGSGPVPLTDAWILVART